MVTNKPVTGESAKETVKPLRGNAGLLPLNLYANVRVYIYYLHTRSRVQQAPAFPAPRWGRTIPLLGQRRALLGRRSHAILGRILRRGNGESVFGIGARRLAL